MLRLGGRSCAVLLMLAPNLVAIRPLRPMVKVALWIVFRPRASRRLALSGLDRRTSARMTLWIVRYRDGAVPLLESSAIAVGERTPLTPLAVNGNLIVARVVRVTILEHRLMAVAMRLMTHVLCMLAIAVVRVAVLAVGFTGGDHRHRDHAEYP
jgi:hypothetical protein